MNEPCPSCAEPLVEGLCFTCDLADVEVEVEDGAPPDPLIGAVIAERYEIRALQGTGGMARIYRAVQRSLDREVVIKVINPDLLAQDDLTREEATTRFMVEAQAASRLNHPNVVSVYDFGQTTAAEGGLLFMVMEYLTGSDLWTVRQQNPEMPFPRIAGILQQTLLALGEAHFLGMAHRDIKPENILIESTRGGRDLVKVIDFGLAKLHALQSVTRVGQTLGTPHYMAPEQIAGGALGSADLYAIGVILFELLTGQVPFDGTNPIEILRKHLDAPRPDPRQVAPQRNIPDALANVCMRAMHVDPQERWPDAESLSAAIVRAVGSADWSSRASLPDSRSLPPPPPSRASPGEARSVPPRRAPTLRQPADEAPLLGRDADLAWASEILLRGGPASGLGLYGPSGVGRTRLLGEICTVAELEGARVVRTRAAPSPRGEVGYSALRGIIASLSGLREADPRLATGQEAGRDAAAAAGLRHTFGFDASSAPRPGSPRERAAAAFVWAVRRAVERASGADVVLALDDAHVIDNASRLALLDGLASAAGLRLLTTSLTPLAFPRDRGASRSLAGLSPSDASQLAEWLGTAPGVVLGRRPAGDIEPLYLELLRNFRLDSGPPPGRLLDVVELGLRALSPAQRRLLLAFAVTGARSREEVAVVARGEDLEAALAPLIDLGLLEPEGQGVRIAHEVFAVVTIATTPAAATALLHTAAAEALATQDAQGELRAHHAVRGSPDFETFLLVEECAALRGRVGDEEGVVAMLKAGLEAGRTLLQHGDVEAGGSAIVVFGQKLGAALRELGRYAEAIGVLEECLEQTGPLDRRRVAVLEELARAAGSRGTPREAAAFRTSALAIARKLGDRDLVQRLVSMARE